MLSDLEPASYTVQPPPHSTQHSTRMYKAVVAGSSNKQQFLQLLNALYTHVQKEKAKVAVAAPELLIGRTVQLHGLSAKPELNGLVGVCERFDKATGRYGVRLEGHENLQALKAANLNLAQGDEL